MKVLMLFALVGVSQAASIIYKHDTAHIPSTAVFQTQDGAGNYAFGYHDGKSNVATFHTESGSVGRKIGSYGLTSADGDVRIVDYVADSEGFRAKIRTNEHGVDTKNPANVKIEEAKVENVISGVPVLPYYNPHYAYSVAGPSYAYVVY